MHPKSKHVVAFDTTEIICSICGEVIGKAFLVTGRHRQGHRVNVIFEGEIMFDRNGNKDNRQNEIRAYRVYL